MKITVIKNGIAYDRNMTEEEENEYNLISNKLQNIEEQPSKVKLLENEVAELREALQILLGGDTE